MEKSHVVLELCEYNNLIEELWAVKAAVRDAVNVAVNYSGEKAATIDIQAPKGSFIRNIIDEKAAETFKGPVAFRDDLALALWSEKNVAYEEVEKVEVPSLEEKDKEKVESALEDL